MRVAAALPTERAKVLMNCGNYRPLSDLSPTYRESLIERIWLYTMPEPNSGCWLWFGNASEEGYGAIHVGSRRERPQFPHAVHRIMFELHRGEIPPGLYVLHRCDTPACCNPDHLFLGTVLDNIADMQRKGRQRRLLGSKHQNAKLTEAEVVLIKRSSDTQKVLAERFGVSKSTIGWIKRGVWWRHVDAA